MTSSLGILNKRYRNPVYIYVLKKVKPNTALAANQKAYLDSKFASVCYCMAVLQVKFSVLDFEKLTKKVNIVEDSSAKDEGAQAILEAAKSTVKEEVKCKSVWKLMYSNVHGFDYNETTLSKLFMQ